MSRSLPPVPSRPDGYALAAVMFAGLCVLVAFGTTRLVRNALVQLDSYSASWEVVFVLTMAAVAVLFWPAVRSLTYSNRARAALARNDIVEVRIDTSASKDYALLTFGWGAFALISLGLVDFVMMNDVAVGKTFFLLPLITSKYMLVLKAFWNNVVIFVVAEILILVWGLVVAIARVLPGPAGRPIRALAMIYCDVFRGLPSIVTLYLVGYGLPLSGLVPKTLPYIGKVPLTWYCILALTLTYGAYVAEVYRAGIESIHASQVAAARSLGLSYLQTLRYVVIPQAVRRILAPLLNDFIGLQKDTAIIGVVGVTEAVQQAQTYSTTFGNFSGYMIAAVLFVYITIPLARYTDGLIGRREKLERAQG